MKHSDIPLRNTLPSLCYAFTILNKQAHYKQKLWFRNCPYPCEIIPSLMSGYAPKTECTSIQKLCIVVWHLNKLHKNGYIKDKCVEREMKYVQLFIIVLFYSKL